MVIVIDMYVFVQVPSLIQETADATKAWYGAFITTVLRGRSKLSKILQAYKAHARGVGYGLFTLYKLLISNKWLILILLFPWPE